MGIVGKILKRSSDLLITTVALLVFWPFLLLIGLLIKLDSDGPVLYRGLRTGKDGVPLWILKFRTMVENAEELGGPSTGKGDPRVTRVGKHLRRYKLDELPQLFNVLVGDMSIVGPRPEVPQYTALYTRDEQRILSVRPGITDYASIEYFQLDEHLGKENADLVYEEEVRPNKNRLRLKYVREQSLMVDFKILAKTLSRFFTFFSYGIHSPGKH